MLQHACPNPHPIRPVPQSHSVSRVVKYLGKPWAGMSHSYSTLVAKGLLVIN